jgi:hypothetical protein
MKKTIIFLSLMLIALGGCSFDKFHKTTGSGTMKVDKRSVPAFDAVDISGAFEVEVVVQKEQSLELEGDDNLLPLIRTEVNNGVLEIKNEKSFSTKNKLRVRISVPSLDGVSTSGASDIVVSAVKSDDFNVNASGAGSLKLSGETKSLKLDTSGACNVDAKDLHAQKVSVDSSGASELEVYATEELQVDSSGAGNVTYYGDPKNVVKETSGAATITKK